MGVLGFIAFSLLVGLLFPYRMNKLKTRKKLNKLKKKSLHKKPYITEVISG
jgi:hypothetical protein